MPEPTTAPVTTKGLRERIIAHLESEPLFGTGEIVDAVMAALAGDPGDLPARMRDAMERVDCPHNTAQGYIGVCLDCFAAAALSVRWRHAAHLAAALEHAQAELSSRVEQHQRAVTRAIAAEGERDALKAAVGRVRAVHVISEMGECIDCQASWPCPTIAALDAPETPGDAVCSYQSEPWSCRGKRQWYVCTRPDGHDDDHQLCVATEG